MGTGQAQNKAGELFVDIGINGVGKALKSLNSISASFLLTKTAAQQVLKPLVNFGKEAASNAVQIGKMSAMFGFTMIEYQKFERYLKDHNLSESLVGDLTKLSDQFTKFKQGLYAFSPEQLWGASKLGINLMEYSGSIEDMMRLVEDVQKNLKEKGMDTNSARVALEQVGLQPEWLYAFQRGDFRLRDALTIPNEQVENLIDLQENWNRTINDLRTAAQKFVGDIAPKLTEFLRNSGPLVEKLLNMAELGIEWFNKVLKKQEPKKRTSMDVATDMVLTDIILTKSNENFVRSLNDMEPWQLQKYRNVGNIPTPSESACIAPNSVTIQVNNDNKINANNPEDVANAISGISQQDILRGQYRVQELLNKSSR